MPSATCRAFSTLVRTFPTARPRRSAPRLFAALLGLLTLTATLGGTAWATVYTSAATGNWNAPATWTPAGTPGAADDVTILSTHTVTLVQNEAVNNITAQGTTGTRLTGAFTLDVNGALGGNTTSPSATLIAATTFIRFVGSTSRALFVASPNWGANTSSLNFEVALDPAAVGTASTAVKGRQIVITSGTFNVTGDLRPDANAANTGTLSVGTGAALSVTGLLSRTGTANTPFASFVIAGTGSFKTTNGGANVWPAATPTTFASTSTVEFGASAAQTIPLATYGNLVTSGTGVKTLAGAATLAGSASTVGAGTTLATGAFTPLNNGTLTVNGTLRIDQGGFPGGGGTYVYGAAGGLTFNNTTGSYGVNNDAYWPVVSGPFNVTVAGAGGITMNVARTVNGLFLTSATVTSAGNLTLNGTAQLNAGGAFAAAPNYGPASLLKYNTGGTYGRFNEWSATSGAGYPANVQLSANTTLDLAANAGAGTARQAAGNLTIDSGSTLNMNLSGGMTQPLSILGNVTISGATGALVLSGNIGGDLNVGGNWTRSGTFTPNNRAVTFNGTAPQTLTGASTFDYLVMNNGAGLTLNNNATVNQTLTFTAGRITTGASKVVIGATGGISGAGASRYVAGNLEKPVTVSAGAFSQTFEVGDATTYAPVTLTQDGPAPGPGGTVIASTMAGDHPQIGTSPINPARSVNRYWTLTNNGLGFSTAKAVFNFANPGDVDAGANPLNFEVAQYDGSTWSSDPVGTRTATSTLASGISTLTEFQVGENAASWTITASAGANGSISPVGAVVVPGGGSQTFTITPDACFSVLDVLVDGVSIGAQTSYTFTNVSANHTISAAFTAATYTINAGICTSENLAGATGGGTLQAVDGGVISPAGLISVACGGTATFTFTPDPCYHLADVQVDGNSVGTPSSYTFNNVAGNHAICAKFAVDTYTITASAGPGGSITPNGASTVDCGSNAVYTITPDPCYLIAGVFVDGNPVGQAASYTFTNVQANHTISATFIPLTYTITASAGAGGAISPNGALQVNCGANQAFTVTPDPCYSIADVLVDGVSQGPLGSYTFTNVQANHTISASFSLATYTISIAYGPGGTGNFAGNVVVACGDPFTVDFFPDPCYRISDVLIDGISVGAPAQYTFTNIQANHTVFVQFAPLTYTITASAGPGGAITPSGAVTVNCGADQTFTITPDPCYSIADVLVDGVSVGATGSYAFMNVQASHTISASFVQTTYTITAQVVNGHGQISPNGAVSVNCGADQTFTLTADDCYHVLDIVVDGVHVGPAAGYTFTNVQANHTIEAYFAIDTFTIAATSGPNGTINPLGNVSVECGASQAFTFIADPCYLEADVIVDGVSLGPLGSYTFTNVTANHTIHVTWILATYTITATAGAGGAITPSGAVSVNCGADQTFTITPDPCFQIADVKVDNVSVGAVGSYTFSSVAANHTIAATFVQQAYTITATAGPHGDIAPSGAVGVPCGGNAGFVITPNAGFAIDDVLVDAVSVGAVPNYTFANVGANHTIHATFRDIECPAVTVTAPNGGETFLIGMAANITWTATDNVGVACVDIELSRTGPGGPFTPLISCIANLGTYAWTVTGPQTNNAVIRVVARDAAGNECFDDSNAEFRIIEFVVPVLLSQFQANPVDDGVELRWALTDNTMFARTGIERAEAVSGPFTPLAATVRVENGQSILLDRDVTIGQTYYYRITGITRSGQTVNFEPLTAVAGQPVSEFALPVVSPNPIHGVAQISFAVPRESRVRVTLLDVLGRPVATLADGLYTAGRYQVSWGGTTESGAAPSGIYFIRLDAPATKLVQRVVLVH